MRSKLYSKRTTNFWQCPPCGRQLDSVGALKECPPLRGELIALRGYYCLEGTTEGPIGPRSTTTLPTTPIGRPAPDSRRSFLLGNPASLAPLGLWGLRSCPPPNRPTGPKGLSGRRQAPTPHRGFGLWGNSMPYRPCLPPTSTPTPIYSIGPVPPTHPPIGGVSPIYRGSVGAPKVRNSGLYSKGRDLSASRVGLGVRGLKGVQSCLQGTTVGALYLYIGVTRAYRRSWPIAVRRTDIRFWRPLGPKRAYRRPLGRLRRTPVGGLQDTTVGPLGTRPLGSGSEGGHARIRLSAAFRGTPARKWELGWPYTIYKGGWEWMWGWSLRAYGRLPLGQFYVNEITSNLSTFTLSLYLFCLYVILMPLLVGFSPEILYHYHLGIIWTCVLFCFLNEPMFESDLNDGTLLLYLLSSCSIERIFLTKLLAFWCLKLFAILASLPILRICYQITPSSSFYLTVILGSFVLTLIWGIYSLFTLGPIKRRELTRLQLSPQHQHPLPTVVSPMGPLPTPLIYSIGPPQLPLPHPTVVSPGGPTVVSSGPTGVSQGGPTGPKGHRKADTGVPTPPPIGGAPKGGAAIINKRGVPLQAFGPSVVPFRTPTGPYGPWFGLGSGRSTVRSDASLAQLTALPTLAPLILLCTTNTQDIGLPYGHNYSPKGGVRTLDQHRPRYRAESDYGLFRPESDWGACGTHEFRTTSVLSHLGWQHIMLFAYCGVFVSVYWTFLRTLLQNIVARQ